MRTIEAMQRQLLGLIGRAVVKSISAATKCQTVDVSLIAGEPKAGVEHLEPYGFTARANSGAEAVRKWWCCFRMATVLMRWLLRCRTGATA
ncbi:tail protein [Shigella flexneri K-1770]|nr:tail protein [Shigella flexneri K-1770]